ncbi:hypothetical protein IJ00_06855 [Calothrix sp. 336/3]|nr:hypothetical protein IJ00_06855 [Calothrix sp. 336/3]
MQGQKSFYGFSLPDFHPRKGFDILPSQKNYSYNKSASEYGVDSGADVNGFIRLLIVSNT